MEVLNFAPEGGTSPRSGRFNTRFLLLAKQILREDLKAWTAFS